MLDRERLLRRTARARISVATQLWSDEGRTIDAVSELIDEAALDSADLLLLPQECVKTEGEPIPGPISEAILLQRRPELYSVLSPEAPEE